MKNLVFIAVIFMFILCITNRLEAQTSIKFIDGIEIKSNIIEYVTIMPIPVLTKAAADGNVKITITSSINIATESCKSIQFKYAQLLEMEIERITNFTMFQFVDEWWKTRYRFGGTSKKGIDCSAFTGLLLNTVYGLILPRTAKEQYAASIKIPTEELKEGDLVFFNTRGGVNHVGVYLANDYFVHASVSDGVTISNLNDSYYSRKYIGSGRIVSNKETTN